MSPKVIKKSKVAPGTVRFEPVTPAKDAKLTDEERAVRERWTAEIKKELAGETAATVQREKEKLGVQFQAELEKFYARSEMEMVELVLSIAARVCRQEMAVNREGVLQWVREGLSMLGEDGPRTVRVHHEDAAHVRAMAESMGGQVRVQMDPTLSPGDVMIDGERDQYDARVSTRLEEVERTLKRLAEEGT